MITTVIPVAISIINYISMHDDDDDEQSPLNFSLNSFHSFFSSLVLSLISFDGDERAGLFLVHIGDISSEYTG